MSVRLPVCTRKISADSYRDWATAGIDFFWMTKYLHSFRSLMSEGSKLTAISDVLGSRVRRGRVSFSASVPSTVPSHASNLGDGQLSEIALNSRKGASMPVAAGNAHMAFSYA